MEPQSIPQSGSCVLFVTFASPLDMSWNEPTSSLHRENGVVSLHARSRGGHRQSWQGCIQPHLSVRGLDVSRSTKRESHRPGPKSPRPGRARAELRCLRVSGALLMPLKSDATQVGDWQLESWWLFRTLWKQYFSSSGAHTSICTRKLKNSKEQTEDLALSGTVARTNI